MSLRRRVALALVLSLGWLSSLAADDAPSARGWYQFRGPHRDGQSSERGLKRAWPPSGPRELWRVPIGVGFSAISVVGDRLYTMDADEAEEHAVCLAAETGRLLWRTPVGLLFEDANGNGPRSGPTVQGGLVYALGSRGRLAALESTTGRVAWQVELSEAFGGELPTWGFASAPLIEGETLVVEVGGAGPQAIAAFEKTSGDVRWTAVEANPAYSSPIGLEVGGRRQLVFLTQQKLLALSPEGEELWSVPFAPKIEHPIVSYHARGRRCREEITGLQLWGTSVSEDNLVLRKAVDPGEERDLERPRAWFFDDYRPVNGVLIPFWVFVEEPLLSREYLFETMAGNVEIDDALFEPPPGAIQTPAGAPQASPGSPPSERGVRE